MRTQVLCQPFALIVFASIVFFEPLVVCGQSWNTATRSTAQQPGSAESPPVSFAVATSPSTPLTASPSTASPNTATSAINGAFAADADFRPLVMRVILATVVVLFGCGLAIIAGHRLFGVQAQGLSDSSLQAMCTLRVSPRAFVSLIKAGNQTLVVGHDVTGLRSMVMLPGNFQDSLQSQIHALGNSPEEPTDTLTKLRSLVTADQARGAYGQHRV